MTGSRRFAGLVLGVAAVTVLIASPASAAVSQEVVRSGATLWTEATVDGAGVVTVTIMAPQADGEGREVWQRCRFQATEAGTYRCGIDVSEGSLAAARKGVWTSKVSVDGTMFSKMRFSI